jgi:hypothetical protein
MGDRSAVGGSIKFESIEKDPVKARLREERKALTEQARRLGGKVEFFSSDSDVNPDFLRELRHASNFNSLKQFFKVTDDALVEQGQLGYDNGLEADAERLVQIAHEHDVLVNGNVTVYGEEPGDIWRLLITDNVVERQSPQIVWPNGDTE